MSYTQTCFWQPGLRRSERDDPFTDIILLRARLQASAPAQPVKGRLFRH